MKMISGVKMILINLHSERNRKYNNRMSRYSTDSKITLHILVLVAFRKI